MQKTGLAPARGEGWAGCAAASWGGAAGSSRLYTGGTNSAGELGTRRAPVAAAKRRGAAPGGVAAAGVCTHGGGSGSPGGGPDVYRAGARLRLHPVGTPAESAPWVSWALGEPRWPPPIAAVRPLGALARPGCARRRANAVFGGEGRMHRALGRPYGVTPVSYTHLTLPTICSV